MSLTTASEAADHGEIAGWPECVLSRTACEGSVQPVCRLDVVCVVHGCEVQSGVGDVPKLQRGVTRNFLLDGDVPLPGVRNETIRGLGSVRRHSRTSKRWSGIKRAVGGCVDDERRRVGEPFGEAHRLTLKELTSTEANRSLSIATHIPGNPDTWSNAVVVFLHQGRVRTGSAVGEGQAYAQARKQFDRILAGRGSRYDQSAVAGIRWICRC